MQSIVHSVQWLRATQELRVHIDVRSEEADLQHPVTASSIVVSRTEYVGGCAMWDDPNTGAYMDHDMVGHPDTYETTVLASRHPTGFTAIQKPTNNRHYKGYLTFRVDDLPTGDYSFDYANEKRVKLFTIRGKVTDRGLDAFFGLEEKKKLIPTYSPSTFDDDTP